jgi:hypothetical protein
MVAAPLMVETMTDADFNARAPLHPDDVPTAREIRLRHNTWMAVGFIVAMGWLHLDERNWFMPVGFIVSVIMGLLIRDTAKTARESFALPMYLLVCLVGSVVGLVILAKRWL